jgi:hypothetical protein
MKMKTLFSKRRFLAALTAALLISAALIASCMNQLEEQADSKVVVPKGKGLVRISVSDNSRTILPSSLPAVTGLYFTVKFSSDDADSGNGEEVKIPASGTTAVAFGALNEVAIPLSVADDWKVVITAWEGSDTTSDNPIAGFIKEDIEVTPSGSTPVDAHLTAFLDATVGSRSGTFSYNITLPDLPAAPQFFNVTQAPNAYNTSKIEIFDHTGTQVTVQTDTNPITTTLTTGTANTANVKLLPGYYRVKVTLTADDCQDRVMEEVLHIYNNKTSTWAAFTPAMLNQNKFSVEFDLDGESPDVGCPSLTTQDGILNAGTVTDPGDPVVVSAKEFDSWWDENAKPAARKWVFEGSLNPTKVFSDKTLTARYKVQSAPGATITITFNYGKADVAEDHNLPVSGATYANIIDGNGTYYFEFTFSNQGTDKATNPVKPATIKWYMDGVLIETGAVLTIDNNFAHSVLLNVGTHEIFVIGDLTNGGVPISSSFNFDINE